MEKNKTEFLPTRSSLVGRIKNLDDDKSWQDFVGKYSPLVKGVAKKKGLTDSEVEDAVQETFITAAKYIKNFDYDPTRSFKAWLLKIAKCRIVEQLRKRPRGVQSRPSDSDETARTKTIEKVPDKTQYGFQAKWDNDDREHDRKTALERVRKKVDPEHYQIFDAYVIKGWTAEEVKKALGVTTIAKIHKVKSRILILLAEEAERLKKRK